MRARAIGIRPTRGSLSYLEGKKGLPPGAPNFFGRATLRFPGGPVWGILGISFGFYCGLPCAGLKVAFPGPEQLSRFWDIRVAALGIIQRSHDLRPSSLPPDPNCRVGLQSQKNAKSQRNQRATYCHGPWSPLGPHSPNWPF